MTLTAFLVLTFFSFSARAADYYTVAHGATTTITEHSECRKVTNTTGSAIFVPSKTNPEWAAFYSTTAPGISVTSCCQGALVGGYCWYIGNLGDSCTTVCSSKGGYNEATRTYAGSAGSNANCIAVMDALIQPGSTISSFSGDEGCSMRGSSRYRGTASTTESGTDSSHKRACACNN